MASVKTRTHRGKEIILVRWYDPVTGDERSKSFAANEKRQADRFARDIEHARDHGGLLDPRRAKVTVPGWAWQWLDGKANLAPKTRDRYAGIIHKHIAPLWSRTELGNVRHADVQRWLTGLDLSPASVRKVHRVFSQVMAYAVKDGRIVTNPAYGVSLPRVRTAEKRYLTDGQVAALAEAVGPFYALVVYFLAYTGLRWGEMAALRVGRVDFLRHRILVAESVTPVKGKMTFGDTKGHERREVSLPSFLVEELSQQVAGKSRDDLVFIGERGGVMRSQTFQRAAFDRAAAEIGVPGLTPHELRHTAASLAIASGANVKIVQQMLGHKSATMTLDLYGHLFEDQLDAVAEKMDAARTVALANAEPKRNQGQIVPLYRSGRTTEPVVYKDSER
jgi:integrase